MGLVVYNVVWAEAYLRNYTIGLRYDDIYVRPKANI